MFGITDQMVDFLDGGAIVKEKNWHNYQKYIYFIKKWKNLDPDFPAGIVSQRWLMRSGWVRLEISGENLCAVFNPAGDEEAFVTGSDIADSLLDWYALQNEKEESALSVAKIGNRHVLPLDLAEKAPFHQDIGQSRYAFLSGVVMDFLRRPYRMLLLKYPINRIDEMRWNGAAFNRKTLAESESFRIILHECVMKLACGKPWRQVSDDISLMLWSRWLAENPFATEKIDKWFRHLSKSIDPDRMDGNIHSDKAGLSQQLSSVCEWCSQLTPGERDLLPDDLREICRLVWQTQSDAISLFHLLPLLPEFDVYLGRGYQLKQTYSAMIWRHLGMKDNPGNKKSTLPIGRHAAIPKKTGSFTSYDFIGEPLRLLNLVGGGKIQKAFNNQGMILWRIEYPDGKQSFWHHSEKLARQDLACHLAAVFSCETEPKTDIIRFLIRNARTASMFIRMNDLNTHRLVNGKSGGLWFDKLACRAVEDLIAYLFGARSQCAPGESIAVCDRGTIDAQEQLGHASIRERSVVYSKYTGPVGEMGIDASNSSHENLKGLLLHHLELYNKGNPMAVIEDKAEIVWDRLIRSGQLPVHQALDALYRLGRIDRGTARMHRSKYMSVIEELSQLSKEYLMQHLDHPSIPKTAAMWVRYSVSRPFPTTGEMEQLKSAASVLLKKKRQALNSIEERIVNEWYEAAPTEEIRSLAKRSIGLLHWLKTTELPERFEDMIRDSIGINEHAAVERFWCFRNIPEGTICLPMGARFIHSIYQSGMMEVLPGHILDDLCPKIACVGWGETSGLHPDVIRKRAERLFMNLWERLNDTDGLSQWNVDPANKGGYLMLVRRTIKNERKGVDEPARVCKDYHCRKVSRLPSAWKGRDEVGYAIETLSIIRDDLARRPMPTQDGILWQGKLFHNESEERPSGIPGHWHVDTPLLSAIMLILDARDGGVIPDGTHMPVLFDAVKSIEAMKCCVTYIDPADSEHTVRLMPGIPEAPNMEARAPYMVHCRQGVYLDYAGQPVPVRNMRRSYIPMEIFRDVSTNITMTRHEISLYQSAVRCKLLSELSDTRMQKKYWWNPEKGDSSFSENIIRLYEDMGLSAAYARGETGLADPVFVETLRFVGRVLNSPGSMSTSLESGMPFHHVILREGKVLKRFYEEAGLTDGYVMKAGSPVHPSHSD